MSYREDKLMSLAGADINQLTESELKTYCKELLKNKIHGICFSVYDENQKPGDDISDEQILKKLEIIKPHVKWIRTFSCSDENMRIPILAKELGFKTLVGAWLGKDLDKNQIEVDKLIELCNDGYIDVAAVGNEVMYRKDLSEEKLIEYIKYVKSKIKTKVPVGYVDAYYEFSSRPSITDACDVILTNCYPYWEGCNIDYSLIYMKQMFYHARDVANGKRVIITETGWPSKGSSLRGADPSNKNFLKYFINAQKWSYEEEIEMFYFSSFDESWKINSEGDVGAFWGIWDSDTKSKFS
ncbi:MAG: glycosyl hydrolase [Flavobacteriaceae bacterium]|jgi:exo-beta-1,3-glucanase (GH17 family)|nr:glycosyl hydrolase [Flavobacteriaceae bacterium]|tara:strand:- start:395 stop:1285 length:891 start_codon:yes stop_codon:yes gene_type:complete